MLTLLLIFLSLITLLLAIVMRPWKSEYYKGAYAEISLWTICRYQNKKYYIKCFYNYYNDITEDIERKKRLAFPYLFIMFASVIFPEVFSTFASVLVYQLSNTRFLIRKLLLYMSLNFLNIMLEIRLRFS